MKYGVAFFGTRVGGVDEASSRSDESASDPYYRWNCKRSDMLSDGPGLLADVTRGSMTDGDKGGAKEEVCTAVEEL
ncbi:uncharacterized protein PHALS_12522 [Plasmopara halstedii]|uniref:Uncharacterized protein n=1 Tax=Plasmopara halstedii TaxID=4781 RepID=A0A0P1ALN2_PLAHL|nr:uncharacterized protein PHALS_12522 [Plasmopara halstedii]CEG42229.1 hypothetical protein PHALS_12522 [Plasmopara halstedii]|eukprot:XP_024578598.1 hypothetical protein PHALS_12522 [Plasmopara halstedii]